MRGTRYGDFSRFITVLRTRQTGLLMQQGRVQLDADWNAQAELADRRLCGAVADILGASGAPADSPGFKVRPRERLEFSGHGAIVTRRRLALGHPGAESFTIEMHVRWAGGAGTLIDLADERGERASAASAASAVSAAGICGSPSATTECWCSASTPGAEPSRPGSRSCPAASR